jgi:hypothetical protein
MQGYLLLLCFAPQKTGNTPRIQKWEPVEWTMVCLHKECYVVIKKNKENIHNDIDKSPQYIDEWKTTLRSYVYWTLLI